VDTHVFIRGRNHDTTSRVNTISSKMFNDVFEIFQSDKACLYKYKYSTLLYTTYTLHAFPDTQHFQTR
jgi:hypothetical protein